MYKMLAGRRVLVVEDEMMVLMHIECMLGDLGCESISVAATVDGALKIIAADHRFDVAMLDVNLGGETSYSVADALALSAVPFVFATGYGKHGIDMRYAARPVLQKPYSEEELGKALAGLLPPTHATTF